MPKKWNDNEVRILLENYRTMPNIDIGALVNRSAPAVKKKMQQLGIKRTANEYDVIKQIVSKRRNTGWFDKGHLPHNTNYNGHERITKDGYIEIRIKQGVYRLKHLVNWEAVNGKLPKGFCLRCKDGNLKNTHPKNWKLITRQENMLLNSRHEHEPALIPVMAAVSKLKSTIKHRQNG
jgi:hypothetical protein